MFFCIILINKNNFNKKRKQERSDSVSFSCAPKALTYSDHIVPSVEKNLISWTQTEALKKKKNAERERGLFAFGVEVGIIPAGLASAEVGCLLATSHHHDSSPTSAAPDAWRLLFDWLILSF